MSRMLRRLLVDDCGQDLVEYALLVALLATLSITALSFLGAGIDKLFRNIAQTFPPT